MLRIRIPMNWPDIYTVMDPGGSISTKTRKNQNFLKNDYYISEYLFQQEIKNQIGLFIHGSLGSNSKRNS